MIKAFSAIAAAAFIAAALTVLPGFAPQVEASVPQALAKGDRLDIRTVGKDCSQQSWPNFEASCLRAARKGTIFIPINLQATAVLASRDAPLLAICVCRLPQERDLVLPEARGALPSAIPGLPTRLSTDVTTYRPAGWMLSDISNRRPCESR